MGESSLAGPPPATGSEREATGGKPGEPERDRTGAPRALFLGTSLTAGLGLSEPQLESWPAVIQRLADSVGVPLHVIQAGLSGETSAGALRRADWLFRQPFDILVIETGANDGLRGLNPDTTAANIRGIIAKARAASPGADILLVQMEAPTNLGAVMTKPFRELFPRVAREAGVTLLPFILEGVGGVEKYNQSDGIHPTAEGAALAARNVWPGIRRVATARASRQVR
ncbi:MAG: arylesterase [Armatimonadetes bacterium]|nr:arylesterase [Armatimonadota bacterium]